LGHPCLLDNGGEGPFGHIAAVHRYREILGLIIVA
jgi:hypothetical protein